jgi:transposase
MDKIDSDLVNLYDTQADLPDVAHVHLRSTQENTRMVKPEIVDRIRELAGQGFGSKRIAREVGASRNSVRRYLAGATAGFQERPAARLLDAATLREVRELFGTIAEGNTVVIQQELARRGLHVELRTLQRAVGSLRQEQRAEALATVRFETPPGHQIQMDFGEKVVRIAGKRVNVYLMTAVLGYSRRLYCRAFLAERQDDWLEGLDGAFRHFSGLTEQVLCDNASPLVKSHDRESGHVVWNPGFEAFCQDRGLSPKACRPRRARTKGKIERGVGYVKHNALAGRPFPSFQELQGHLAKWMVEVADQRIHGTTRERPAVRFERDERQALRPLPTHRLAVRTRRLKRRISADCFVDIDTIRYSTPYQHVRETVEVVVHQEQVEIWLRGSCIAQHARCFEPHTWVRNPAHFEGLFRRKVEPEASTSAEVIADPVSRPLSIYTEAVEGGRPWAR